MKTKLKLTLLALVITFSASCTVRVDSDGSKTYGADLDQVERAVKIYAEK